MRDISGIHMYLQRLQQLKKIKKLNEPLVLQEEEEAAKERPAQGGSGAIPKKTKITVCLSVCVSRIVCVGGGPKRGRRPMSMYMTEFVACFFRGVWKHTQSS